MYELYNTEDPDSLSLPCAVTSFFRLATLEIVVKDISGIASLVLILGSYALDDTLLQEHGEGYWAPPNVAYHINLNGFTSPSTLGSLRKKFNTVSKNRRMNDVQQLAYSLGLRDTYISYAGSFIEIKKSPRTPENIRAFYIDRYVLDAVDNNSLRNIADPEVRHGLVFAPLDSNSPYYKKRKSSSHDIDEIWFLGKPLQTNVKYLLENKSITTRLINSAKNIEFENFSISESGTICVIDVAGYGAALQHTQNSMISFKQTESEIMQDFRFFISKRLIDFVSELGTTQIQMAGDGLICAFPSRIFNDGNLLIKSIINKWEKTIAELEKINLSIKNDSKKVGSRIVLLNGFYRYGRINGMMDFSPAFDGQSIIEAIRLEQGLSTWTKEREIHKKHNTHYLAYIKNNTCIPETLSSWQNCGEHHISAKEYSACANILVYTVK